MFYYLAQLYGDTISGVNVLNYITFRAGGAVLTALLISFIFGPKLIGQLRARQQKGQPIREDGPPSHLLTKVGTPTMGGLLILISVGFRHYYGAICTTHFYGLSCWPRWLFGAIGFCDDYLKIKGGSSDGVPGRIKLILEALVAPRRFICGFCANAA